MITPEFVRTMAAYNAELNRRVYGAAGRLPDAERRADGGAFWKSILGTLAHVYWADRMWLSRLGVGKPPEVPIGQSDRIIEDFDALWAARQRLDAEIEAWAAGVEPAALEGELEWFSGATRRQMRKPQGALRDAGVQPPDASPRAGACAAHPGGGGYGGDGLAVRAAVAPCAGTGR